MQLARLQPQRKRLHAWPCRQIREVRDALVPELAPRGVNRGEQLAATPEQAQRGQRDVINLRSVVVQVPMLRLR